MHPAVRLVGWGLPLVTAAVYGWLVLGHGLALEAMAGGQPPFDLRLRGYGLDEARRYLAALPAEGVARYLGPVRALDTAFPVLMGLTFLWWLRPLAGGLALAGAAAALGYVALDLAENAVVAGLLRAGPAGIETGSVALASTLTQAKFAAFGLTAVLTGWRIWQRRG